MPKSNSVSKPAAAGSIPASDSANFTDTSDTEYALNHSAPISEDVNRVLSIAMEAGQILLENGAEISRVEETMSRIASAYGVTHDSFFVLANGIFITGWDRENKWPGSFAKVKHIPLKATHFDRIDAVNKLSREIVVGQYTLDETEAKLQEIKNSKEKPLWSQLVAAFFGAGCFSVIFGGSLLDALFSAIAGLLIWPLVLFVSPKLSKITANILAAAVASLFCALMQLLVPAANLSHMIIGAVIPLVPGVAFTNGARDLAHGDYIAGLVRLADAILGFISIGVGVGIVFLIYFGITGGAVL